MFEKRLNIFLFFSLIVFILSQMGQPVIAQEEETNISALLQSALNTAVKTFNSQNQPEAILQLNQIIDLCQENKSSRELTDEENKILAKAHEYRGRAFYNIGETEKAQTDFKELVKINPRYKMDSNLVSPKIVTLFDKIKNSMVGNLAVFSTPSGSEVLINGKFLSLTPMYATELLKGKYSLEVKHKGFDIYKENLTILANTPLEKEVTLIANTGTCIFYSSPSDVKIYLDGNFVGNTFGQAAEDMIEIAKQINIPLNELSAPLKIEYVTPGEHRLELKKECFQTIIRSISVEIKTHNFEPFIMEPSRTSIQVNSSVPGSSVYLSDAFKGVTPLTLKDICTGDYVLTVKKEKIGKWFQDIKLIRGEARDFNTIMRPTVTYLGIINGAERESKVVERVNNKLISIFKSLKSVNFALISDEKRIDLTHQLGFSFDDILNSEKGAPDTKKKGNMLTSIGNKLKTDLMIIAILPEEKLQRHVELQLFSIYHYKPDIIHLTFNDSDDVSKFVANMDADLNLQRNWIGLVTIDTSIHKGLVTIRVSPNSPAQKAGLAIGDIITKINNSSIANNRDFKKKLASISKNKKIKLSFKHNGLIKAVSVSMATTPIEMARNNPKIYYNKAIAQLKLKIVLEKNKTKLNYYLLNLGFCYMHFNNWQKAIEDAFTNTSLPSSPGISAGTLDYYIALCYQKLGYNDEAKKFYKAALKVKDSTLESNDGPSVTFMADKALNEIH